MGKAGDLKELVNLSLNDYTMDDLKVTILSPDVVLLTDKWTLRGTYEGRDLESKPHYCGSVYARRDGQWLSVFLQETRER